MNPVFLLDASSALNAWSTYPIGVFKTMWTWLDSSHISGGTLQIVRENLEEINHKEQKCCETLKAYGIKVISPTDRILQSAESIKSSLGISDDRYTPKGVDYNDLLLIATAEVNGYSVISDEYRQPSSPSNIANAKIPLVCQRQHIKCMSFTEWLTVQNPTF